MAPGGSRPCRSPHRNLLFLDPVENELARDADPVRGSHSGSTSPAPSCNPTPGLDSVPTLVSAPIPALIPTPASVLAAINDLFKQFMKAYLELNQRPRQPPAECKQPLKAKVPELYYGKLHIDCYHFCQQCKDYFESVGATGANRTPFTAFFLYESISVQ